MRVCVVCVGGREVVVPLLQRNFSMQEQLFVSFSGLRGAVPIALAIDAAAHPTIGPEWGQFMPPLALGVVLLAVVDARFPLSRRAL